MTEATRWHERAAGLRPPRRAFVDGAFVDSGSGERFECRSPIDNRLLAEVTAGDESDVDRAVRAARAAFADGRWSRRSPQERRRVLLRLAELVEESREELALLETMDVGKPIAEALSIDLRSVVANLRYFAEAIDKVSGEIAPTAPDVLALVSREPLGVVGAVTPWNYPLLMAVWKIAPALAAGNSVVLKPAEQTPLSALRLAELAAEAGLPDGVLNVVPGDGPTAGAALGRHPDVDRITFTGSTEVGRLFLRYSAESNLKQVALECGGKSPHIVFADTDDLERAALNVASGIFVNQGEVCNAGSRLLVAEEIRDDFVEMVRGQAARYRPGDPLDPETTMGALISQTHMDRVLGFIESGVSAGAELLTGGRRARPETGGFYVEPTIFDRVTNDMEIAQEEIFGPVLSIIGFRGVDEAVRLANESRYGLAAGIWTGSVKTAHRVASRLQAGTVWVNCFDSSDVTVPFGGYKQSGFGRDKSLHALLENTQLKTTWIDNS